MRMRKTILSLAILVMCFTGAGKAKAEENVEIAKLKMAATAAAYNWLVLIDESDFQNCWLQASEVLKNTITMDEWLPSLISMRKPLGIALSRKLSRHELTRSLDGDFDKKQAVITFSSSFENKANAKETLQVALEPDGRWRVSGYYVE